MKLIQRLHSPNSLLFVSIFLVTQVTGLLLSMAVCFILQDFTWGFVRVASIHSFILGLSLIGGCYLSQRLVSKVKIVTIFAVSFSFVLGAGVISFFFVLFLEPAVFIYYDRGVLAFVSINLLFIVALHIISSGLIIYREIMVGKEKAIGAERYLKNQIEMKLLSSRINPHFLFNTLNLILTLLKQPDKAETAILNLSDLLRQNLEQSDKMTIPLGREIENIRNYLEIQKLRFGDKLHYEIKGDADFSIPPMIVQPIIENSIKHNMQRVSRLAIEIIISRDFGRNSIVIMDSEKALCASMLDQGHGLTITKKRVENGNGTLSIKNGGIELSFAQ